MKLKESEAKNTEKQPIFYTDCHVAYLNDNHGHLSNQMLHDHQIAKAHGYLKQNVG